MGRQWRPLMPKDAVAVWAFPDGHPTAAEPASQGWSIRFLLSGWSLCRELHRSSAGLLAARSAILEGFWNGVQWCGNAPLHSVLQQAGGVAISFARAFFLFGVHMNPSKHR